MSRRYLALLIAIMLVVTVLALLFPVMGAISYLLVVLSVWLAIGIIVVWLLAFLASKIHLLSRTFRLSKPLKLSLLLFVAGSTGLIVLNLYAPSAVLANPSSYSQQLAYIYKTDQADRQALRLLHLNERDQQRLEQVLTFYEQGLIKTPEQQYQGAMILQHGAEPEHYELAYQLAQQASENGVEEAEWLWQAAYDRWQISQGKPQVYGTQSTATISFFGVSFEQQ